MNNGIWFRCKGCGQPAGYFPVAHTDGGRTIPAGAVTHTKPERDANVRPVQCPLFQTLEADEYWAVHRDAERTDGPESLRPVVA